MMRSLAYQMASRNVHVRQVLLETFDKHPEYTLKGGAHQFWRRIFQNKVFPLLSQRSIFWVIDAFDECWDQQDFVSILKKIDDWVPVKIFLTCGNTTLQGKHLQMPPALRAEISRDNCVTDIRLFLESNTKHLPAGDEASLCRLLDEIVLKSEGCFLLAGLLHRELEQTHSIQQAEQVLKEVPSGMAEYYLGTLRRTVKPNHEKLFKAVLRWTVCVMRPLNTKELQEAIWLDIGQKVPRIESLIQEVCGQFVYVESQTQKVKLHHGSAGNFFLKNKLASKFEIYNGQGHLRIAETCLHYLNGKQMKVDTQRKRKASDVDQGLRSVLCDYICRYFSSHLRLATQSSETLPKLLSTFLRANVLSWIEFLAQERDLDRLIEASKDFRAYLSRGAKNAQTYCGEEDQLIDGWALDLRHLVISFGDTLIHSPSSTHYSIPPLCAPSSKIHQLFGLSLRGLQVVGLSMKQWDDRICSLNYYSSHSQACTALACGDNQFAVGLPNGNIKLYYMSTCQEARPLHHGAQVRQLRFANFNELLISASSKCLILWDCNTGSQIWSVDIPAEPLSIAFEETSNTVKTAFQGCQIISYDLSDGCDIDERSWFNEGESQHTKIRQSPHHAELSIELSLLAVAYRGKPILLWDWKDDSFLGLCDEYEGRKADALVFSPSEEPAILAVAFQDGQIVTYDP